jgi:hypothetical protein
MNCRLIKHRPYRTPIIREDQFSVGGLLNLELLRKQPYWSKPLRLIYNGCDMAQSRSIRTLGAK